MSTTEMKGLVQTVLGPISPDDLGPTMTHEHLLIDFSFMLKPPAGATDVARADEPITLENLGWIRHNHYSNKANLMVVDEDTAISEAMLFKRQGGGTIVDATTLGIGRDPMGLARISRASGVHVVMGAGYYVGPVHPANMDEISEGDITRKIVDDIVRGVDDTGVKAGIIGEIGCTWPLAENERKVLRGAAAAQRETGAAILIHPGRDPRAPREILDVLAEAGADIGRVIMGHLDRTVWDVATLLDIAQSDCYMEWDLFGNESSYYPLAEIDMPSDAQRLDLIKAVVDEGFGERIVIAHDICTNHRLVKYGGHGYGHILENIVPRMRRRGFSEDSVNAITVSNPANILAFV